MRSPRPLWNFTAPAALAKIVWSRPMPTCVPGWNLVPRWRTMMLPGTTAWPPHFLTPRRRPALSRPLRDEPPAFLCAMSRAPRYAGRSGAGLDVVDAQHGDRLAMPVLAPVVVAAALLEDEDLVAALLLDDGCAHSSARHRRGPRLGLGALAEHENL